MLSVFHLSNKYLLFLDIFSISVMNESRRQAVLLITTVDSVPFSDRDVLSQSTIQMHKLRVVTLLVENQCDLRLHCMHNDIFTVSRW